MALPEVETTEPPPKAVANDCAKRDRQEWACPSDLPEVVQPSYPEAYGYVRPRAEPGEKAEKILAYDQTGKEVHSDILGTLNCETAYQAGQFVVPALEERRLEKPSYEKTKHRLRGCTAWRLVLLAVVVIMAAVGGGVGGGIASTKSQQAFNNPVTVTMSRYVNPFYHITLQFITKYESSILTSSPSSVVPSTTTSAPTGSQTSSAAGHTAEGHCFSAPNGTATGNYLLHGICLSTVTCTSFGGSYINGGCPLDAEDIKCCYVAACKGTDSFCGWTVNDCNGTYLTSKNTITPVYISSNGNNYGGY